MSFFLFWSVLTDRPPPIIRQGPANQTLGVDSIALLKCQASGEPVPTISWLKDGVSLLGKDPRMSLQELGSLQIKNIRVRVKKALLCDWHKFVGGMFSSIQISSFSPFFECCIILNITSLGVM